MRTYKFISAKYRALAYAALACGIIAAAPAQAGTLEQAKRIHDRLTGVPPDGATLSRMQLAIQGGACGINTSELGNSTALGGVAPCSPLGAAYLAMSNKAFYNATLKNWITPWTNRDDDKFAPLNDYTATVIGIIRDGDDYRKVLYDDVLYVPVGFGAYAVNNNNAYAALEAADADMSSGAVLSRTTQVAVTGTATAGVMTTRAAARAFFIDGTNRAMFRFTLKNHLCNDLEQVQDITRPADRIRQDVSRSPGGDSRIFMNTCVGCHSGMDPLAQAFAYYNFNYDKTAPDQDAAKAVGSLQYTPGVVQAKYFINDSHFPEGYVTPNDHWDNYWRDGPNTAIFGWENPGNSASGDGAKSMGQELAHSQAFAVCSVKKVFKAVCLREPGSSDQSTFTTMLGNFNSTRNLKHTFAEAAVYCAGN